MQLDERLLWVRSRHSTSDRTNGGFRPEADVWSNATQFDSRSTAREKPDQPPTHENSNKYARQANKDFHQCTESTPLLCPKIIGKE